MRIPYKEEILIHVFVGLFLEVNEVQNVGESIYGKGVVGFCFVFWLYVSVAIDDHLSRSLGIYSLILV